MFTEENRISSMEGSVATGAEVESQEPNPAQAESGEASDLLENLEALPTLAQGEIVKATVLKLTDEDVIVDVGLKSEGAIPRSELLDNEGRVTVAPGDEIDVWVEHFNEKEGTVTVSHRKAARSKAWETVERAFEEGAPLKGRVVERIKGGLTVDIGVPAFLPGSQVDIRPHFHVESLVGQEIECKIIKLNKKRHNAVVSRRLLFEEDLQKRKAGLMERLHEGAELEGRVKNLTDYGAFVDLGGMDGLLHITDLSWGRVRHPSEVVQVGQELTLKVLKYDPEKGRISLGLKQLSPDPWEDVPKEYTVGQKVVGRVVGTVDYGAFVELEPGVEGLIHVSEMTWSKRAKHPSKILEIGERVEAAILEVKGEQRRISLSLKQTLAGPWTTLAARHATGDVVQGVVHDLTESGVFVEIESGVDGLIHLSNLSASQDVKHPSEILRKGQKVEAVILGLDASRRRLSLGLKQLQPDAWSEFFSRTQVGSILRGKVLRLVSFGAFVALEEEIEGLCHISELSDGPGNGEPEKLAVGFEGDFRVIRLNPVDKKIGLSRKGLAMGIAPAEPSEVTTANLPAPAEDAPAAERLSKSPLVSHVGGC